MKKLFGLLVLVMVLVLCCTGALAWDTYTYEGEYFCPECNATVPGRFIYARFENHHNLEFYCTLHWVDITDGEPHSFDNDADPTCNTCGYSRGVAEHVHVWSSEWSGNNWFHWHDCTADGCDLPSNLGEGKEGFGHHTLGEGHTHAGDGGAHKGTCTVCGETDAWNYLYTPTWKYDDTYHWGECGCGVKEIEGKHHFDNDDDLTCNGLFCGYTRAVAHEHSGGTPTCTEQAVCEGCGESYGEVDPNAHDWGEWEFGNPEKALGHMRHCKRDYAHIEKNDHTGGNPTCSESATCEGCGGNYFDSNNHAYDTTEWRSNDDTKHVKLCEGCKYVVDRAPHAFDNDADPTCNDCGYTREVAHEHYGGTATCTEQAVCKGCGEVIPASGHSYEAQTVAPACTKGGYTIYTCSRCGDSYTADETPALWHWYGLWSPNQDGTHSAACKRSGCSHVSTTACTLFEITLSDGETDTLLTVCPVCGDHGATPFEVNPDAVITPVDRNALPNGEGIIRSKDAPFDGALYALTVAYEYAGKVVDFRGTISVTLPLDAEKYGAFQLVRVDGAERTEVAFTFENGELTFETDAAGLFLLLPVE